MSSPAPEAKRARPKPKPRVKAVTTAAAAPPTPARQPAPVPTTLDLTSSSPSAADHPTSSLPTPTKRRPAGRVEGDEAPSWVVGSQLLSDDIEIVETSAQARKRQRSQRGLATDLDDDSQATIRGQSRRKEEEEERERLAEDEWMAQARRGVRHVLVAPAAKGKGKGRASPSASRLTSPGRADSDADSDAGSGLAREDNSDEGEFSARNMRRYKRNKQGKHRWMEQADAELPIDVGSGSSSFESDKTPQRKRLKADKKSKAAARLRRNSLTPPPPVADAVMQHAENRVHGALDTDILNPLLRGAAPRPASDDEDDIDYFGTAAAPARSPPSPTARRARLPVDDVPIELGDSDDDDVIQTTFVKSTSSAAADSSTRVRASSSHSRTHSHTRSPSAQAGRSGHNRNPLMFGAPDEVKISLRVKSHLDPAKASKAVIDYVERPIVFKVSRWEPIRTLIAEAEKAKKYDAGSLIVTKDDSRVYPSTNPETLGFYSGGELVGYRRDVYETHKRKQEAERQQQAFLDAQLARDTAAAAAAATAAGHDLSSPVTSTSALPRANNGAGPSTGHVFQGSRPPSQVALGSDDDDEGNAPTAAAATTTLKVTMRGKGGAEVKLMVKPSQTIAAMLKHYGRKMNLDEAASARLRAEWDGEELGRDLTVGETEMEDGDLLEIVGV